MNQLSIQAFSGEINNQTTTLVNARDLHAHLGIKTVFANWILRRIEDFGFIKNEDFIIIDPLSKNGKQSTTRVSGWFGESKIDYHLTLDMAKELCMVERSEIGRKARRYFIEIEKEHREAMPQWAVAQLADYQSQLFSTRALLLMRDKTLAEIVRYRGMRLSPSEIAKLVGVSKDTVRVRIIELQTAGFFKNLPKLSSGRVRALGHTALDAVSPSKEIAGEKHASSGEAQARNDSNTARNDTAQPSLIG